MHDVPSTALTSPRRGRYPFTSFPDGWFTVARATDLAPGAVLPVRYFGRDLVLFRTASGTARLLDAYCPHLGAHLGHGGEVRGESVRCPFHGWCFDGASGACTEVPYAKKIPPKARVGTWTLCERNGLLMAWHHHAGAPPSFEVPEVPELASAEWTPPHLQRWQGRTHIQEISENILDVAHGKYLHGMGEVQRVERFLTDGPRLDFRLAADGIEMDGVMCGMGFSVYRFRTSFGSGFGHFMHVVLVSPVDEEHVDFRWLHTVRRTEDAEATRRFEAEVQQYVARGVEADLRIFEHKRYEPAPLLAEGDGPIIGLRRWAQQFYPPG